jgi:hypothetical protein
MPVSFNGFGPLAILIMVLSLIASQAYKKYRNKQRNF